ncbi:hypothetical protein BC833DRAFT_602576 [Globomyces pollinis-pini]|nr:hypothetical protein BC833DRAFT_602576 [Globomyces pollinis-pini]
MPTIPDYCTLLEDFIPSIDNLPSELSYVFSEFSNTSQDLIACDNRIKSNDSKLRKLIKSTNTVLINDQLVDQNVLSIESENHQETLDLLKSHSKIIIGDHPELLPLYDKVQEDYTTATALYDNRLELIDRIKDLLDKHIKRLSMDLEKLENPDLAVNNTPSVATPQVDIISRKNSFIRATSEVLDSPVTSKRKIASVPRPPPIKKSHKRKMESGHGVDGTTDVDENTYCTCQQVSFGEMIACDNQMCPYEWFHLECVGLSAPPTGVWFCTKCRSENS